MIKGQILYAKKSGSTILFDEIKDGVIYAHVKADGQEYESRTLTGILAKGYWDEVYISSDVDMVEKHGSHDQKTHGAWATGQTSNSIDENEIYEKYQGYKLDDLESGKISWYIQNGVRLNKELRTDQTDQTLIEKAVKEIDSAIDRAPKFPNREVYRVAPSFLIEGMKPGTVIQDLGYQSTTIADLTKPENGVLLLSLSGVSSGQKSLIRINTGSKGTGLYLPAVSNDPVSAHEQEFLLPRNTKLRYTGNEKFQSSTIHKFEVVNDN